MYNRNLILYISCTLDGFISKPNGDLGFLSVVQKEGEDYGYNDFVETVDTVIMGRKTYDWIVGQGYKFPHSDKESYIITRQERAREGNLTFYNGDLKTLVSELKAKKGKNIFCDGGSEIVNLLLSEKLFDRLIISVVPIWSVRGQDYSKTVDLNKNLNLFQTKAMKPGLFNYITK